MLIDKANMAPIMVEYRFVGRGMIVPFRTVLVFCSTQFAMPQWGANVHLSIVSWPDTLELLFSPRDANDWSQISRSSFTVH